MNTEVKKSLIHVAIFWIEFICIGLMYGYLGAPSLRTARGAGVFLFCVVVQMLAVHSIRCAIQMIKYLKDHVEIKFTK